jgi:hypothetical protein
MPSSGALSLPVQQTNEKKVKQKEIRVVKDHSAEAIEQLMKMQIQQNAGEVFSSTTACISMVSRVGTIRFG